MSDCGRHTSFPAQQPSLLTSLGRDLIAKTTHKRPAQSQLGQQSAPEVGLGRGTRRPNEDVGREVQDALGPSLGVESGTSRLHCARLAPAKACALHLGPATFLTALGRMGPHRFDPPARRASLFDGEQHDNKGHCSLHAPSIILCCPAVLRRGIRWTPPGQHVPLLHCHVH
ncbi:hypothetical protein T440DRAFT_477461 [Plenodomus tracheiphilus IPT5]|uniref:Uncharacterized protein n=1 Tax=Plenodomus tracheiphilus IPT5 TaxID=1408161 RepID=A0A6A7BB80_9PLEO|nr:hypothetical protein T440DRAFT_477461 [Plenodomus tracheiphilus IPT5]